jgi:galactokinase
MDQTIASFAEPGTALLLDTVTGERRLLPLPGEFWVMETGISHRLTGGELNARRQQCETALERLQAHRPNLRHLAQLAPEELSEAMALLNDQVLARRLRHVVTETARTRAAAAALEAGDLVRLGSLLVQGHQSLRDDYESSMPEADLLVTSAIRHGALGARLTGAGWGGAVVMLAPPGRGEKTVHEVTRDFAGRYGSAPVAWSSRAAAGVQLHTIGS